MRFVMQLLVLSMVTFVLWMRSGFVHWLSMGLKCCIWSSLTFLSSVSLLGREASRGLRLVDRDLTAPFSTTRLYHHLKINLLQGQYRRRSLKNITSLLGMQYVCETWQSMWSFARKVSNLDNYIFPACKRYAHPNCL